MDGTPLRRALHRCCRPLYDLGAGVGEYGRSLAATLGDNFSYHGFDGAGNVEAFTAGFVSWTDLSLPVPYVIGRDSHAWALSLEAKAHQAGARLGRQARWPRRLRRLRPSSRWLQTESGRRGENTYGLRLMGRYGASRTNMPLAVQIAQVGIAAANRILGLAPSAAA